MPPGKRLQAQAIALAGYPAIAALCRTLRWRVDGGGYFDEILRSGRRPILALWHGRIFAGLHYFRGRGVVVITSQNFDGEWIARILLRFGFGVARGSTSRGGARALVQLRQELAAGHPAAFTVDGPRGPARVAQAGAVWLAGATGQSILPFHIEADRYWTASSWDRTQIPKPFATVAIALGPPLEVSGTDADVVEDGRRRLEAALGEVETRALSLVSTRVSTLGDR